MGITRTIFIACLSATAAHTHNDSLLYKLLSSVHLLYISFAGQIKEKLDTQILAYIAPIGQDTLPDYGTLNETQQRGFPRLAGPTWLKSPHQRL